MTAKPVAALEAAKTKLRELTHSLAGIEGIGTDGRNLRIYVSDEKSSSLIPKHVDGYPVVVLPEPDLRAQT